MKKQLTSVLVFLLMGASLMGQQSISLELGGKSILWGTLNYEYSLGQGPFGVGGFLGYTSFQQGNVVIPKGGDTISYTSSELILPGGAYAFGSWGDRHRFNASLGIMIQGTIDRSKPSTEGPSGFSAMAAPFVGAGYEWRPGKWFFRATAYAILVGDYNNIYAPPVLPWLGGSIGRVIGE